MELEISENAKNPYKAEKYEQLIRDKNQDIVILNQAVKDCNLKILANVAELGDLSTQKTANTLIIDEKNKEIS